MKIAVISDIHGNLEALTAVLKDIESMKVDRIHCLGDVVGYGCNPRECLELVTNNCEIKLVGNHEFMVMGLIPKENCNSIAQISLKWTREQLTDYEMTLLEEFEINRTEGSFHFVHASPHEPDQWNYILDPVQADLAFKALKTNYCFVGHSHIPLICVEMVGDQPRMKTGHDFVMDEEYRYIINVGSVGQPRDSDPNSCYVTVDTESLDVNYRRIEYDVAKTQQKMTQAELPEMLVKRLSIGR